MKHFLSLVAVAAVAVFFSGCEGGSGGFNERLLQGLDFNGVYVGVDGILVTKFTRVTVTTTESTSEGEAATTVTVTDERIGTGDDSATFFTGDFNNTPIVPNSVTVTAGGLEYTDDGDGNLVGSIGDGTIDYATGSFTLNTVGPVNSGDEIQADYEYEVAATEVDEEPVTGDIESGAGGGITIFSFTVTHQGNRLTIIDNNGSIYEGEFSEVRASGEQTLPGGSIVPIGTISASFSVTGVSSAGARVTMVGTFGGNATSQAESSQTLSGGGSGEGGDLGSSAITVSRLLTDRTINGVWLEEGTGVSGDINGVSRSEAAVEITLDGP